MIEARSIERTYRSPEITHQRLRTLEALNIQPGEAVLDAGCGPGLLTEELARLAGGEGRILAVDKSDDMLALARERLRDLPSVELEQASIERLGESNQSFDAVACTQVLLHIENVAGVIAEMHRLLKPGGRFVIIETDWRGCVLSSSDFGLTETMINAWDDAMPSPNLPVRLAPMLRSAGFGAVRVEPVPVLNTSLVPDGYSKDIIHWFTRKAVEQGRVTEVQAEAWLRDLYQKAARGEYFFCVNRFLFSAVK